MGNFLLAKLIKTTIQCVAAFPDPPGIDDDRRMDRLRTEVRVDPDCIGVFNRKISNVY